MTNILYSLYNRSRRSENSQNHRKERYIEDEENLSAEEKTEKSGTRLQKKNEHVQRQKSLEAQTCERQSKTDLLKRQYKPSALCISNAADGFFAQRRTPCDTERSVKTTCSERCSKPARGRAAGISPFIG